MCDDFFCSGTGPSFNMEWRSMALTVPISYPLRSLRPAQALPVLLSLPQILVAERPGHMRSAERAVGELRDCLRHVRREGGFECARAADVVSRSSLVATASDHFRKSVGRMGLVFGMGDESRKQARWSSRCHGEGTDGGEKQGNHDDGDGDGDDAREWHGV